MPFGLNTVFQTAFSVDGMADIFAIRLAGSVLSG